jgi:hypothetical protein
MTDREKKLAGAVAAVAVVWGGMKGVDRYRTALARNVSVQKQAVEALDEAEFAEARGERARRRLIEWGRRSLPTDRDVGESLYHDWLRKELTAAGLTVEQLAEKPVGRANPKYGEVAVDVRAVGTVAQLADFLYKFYTAPHLHRISSATITPSDGGAKLTAALGVDALILPEASRKDKLAEGDPQKLPLTQEELRKSVVDRNLFAAYTGEKADGGAGEESKAVVRGFVSDADAFVMTIKIDEPAKTRHFRAGDSIEFGKFSGKVVELDGRHAVIETANGKVEVRLGQNLGEAKPVPAPAT